MSKYFIKQLSLSFQDCLKVKNWFHPYKLCMTYNCFVILKCWCNQKNRSTKYLQFDWFQIASVEYLYFLTVLKSKKVFSHIRFHFKMHFRIKFDLYFEFFASNTNQKVFIMYLDLNLNVHLSLDLDFSLLILIDSFGNFPLTFKVDSMT